MNIDYLKIYAYCSLAGMLIIAVIDRKNPRRVLETGGLLALLAASYAVPRWIIDGFIPPMETKYVIYVSNTFLVFYSIIWFVLSLPLAVAMMIGSFLYRTKSLSFIQTAVCNFLQLNLLTAAEIMLGSYFPSDWTAPYPFGWIATAAAIATVVLSITLLCKYMLPAAKAYENRNTDNRLEDAMTKS